MVNDISIKTELKTDPITAATPAGVLTQPKPSAAAVTGFDLLSKAGFDRATARRLAQRRSAEVIQRQLDWLPLRSSTRNRLGLLRRAIERDWPKPERGTSGTPESGDLALGRIFASHYYAVYHGFIGEAATEPFPKDLRAASVFVERLLGIQSDEDGVPEWGRRFGRLMHDKHYADPTAKPYLSCALVLYGDEFLRSVRNEIRSRRRQTLGRAKEAHQTAFLTAYRQYLRSAEEELSQARPALYADFVEKRRHTRQMMTGGLFLASADTLARFDCEESRLHAFAEFFGLHPQCPVMDFWQWDTEKNPSRFDDARLQPEPGSATARALVPRGGVMATPSVAHKDNPASVLAQSPRFH